jgi:sugar/nucleoside kinase (ribokinase family)
LWCRLISVEERTKILELLADHQYQISAGGSLSNTLIDLARLGNANGGEGSIKVSMAGLVGGDAFGAFYKSQMSAAGVSVLASGDEHVHTGTVIVLTTEDAQRTMLSYLGTQNEVDIDAALEGAIQQTSILVIEGYMWELPNSTETIKKAIEMAKKHGVRVAMTAGDAGVVERHSSKIWECILLGIDIFFTNAEEAAALARHRPVEIKDRNMKRLGHAATMAEAAALCLGPYCPIVCVTDGSAGSIIASMGRIWVIPPHWNDAPPKDTCGAGDAWAAGLLFGILQGADIVSMGHIAARAASAVISKHGPTLCPSSAESVVASKTPVTRHDLKRPSQQQQSAALPFNMHGYSM